MTRVLQVQIKGSESYGGIESFLDSVYFSLDHSRCQVDFLFIGDIACPCRSQIESLGGEVYHLPIDKNDKRRHTIIQYGLMKGFCKEHRADYDVIHINNGEATTLFSVSLAARIYGGKGKVVVHVHSARRISEYSHPFIALFSREAMRFTVHRYLVCSHLAAERVLPRCVSKKKRYTLVKNALDTEKFAFDPQVREEIRSDLELDDRFVIGHVGRFAKEKNHGFLLKLFRSVYQSDPCARLLLVGSGEGRVPFEKKVKEYRLESVVHILGDVPREYAAKLYQAMDVFVLPSFYEGFPVVGVEAQTAGLPMVVSDNVTSEMDFTGLVTYLSLDDDMSEWVKAISRPRGLRRSYAEAAIKNGYDIQTVTESLMDLYEEITAG